MLGRVDLEEVLGEQLQPRRDGLGVVGELADGVDLPEDERCGWVERVPAKQELRRLVALPASLAPG